MVVITNGQIPWGAHVRMLIQQYVESGNLQPERSSLSAKLITLGTSHGDPTFCRFNSSTLLQVDEALYLIDAGAPHGDGLDHRAAESIGEQIQVDRDPEAFGLVPHVEDEHDPKARVDHLDRRRQGAIEVGGLHDVEQRRGRRREQSVAGHPFLLSHRQQAVGAGSVESDGGILVGGIVKDGGARTADERPSYLHGTGFVGHWGRIDNWWSPDVLDEPFWRELDWDLNDRATAERAPIAEPRERMANDLPFTSIVAERSGLSAVTTGTTRDPANAECC